MAQVTYRHRRLAVEILLEADTSLPIRQTSGCLGIHVERGHIHVRALGRLFDLGEDAFVALNSNVPHQIHALAPSAIVMTVEWLDDQA